MRTTNGIVGRRCGKAAAGLLVLVAGLLANSATNADDASPWGVGARLGSSDVLPDLGDHVSTRELFLRRRIESPPQWLGPWLPEPLELHLGAFVSHLDVNGDSTNMIAGGPLLSFRPDHWPVRLTAGVQPSLIGDDRLGHLRLGGTFQFTSHMAAGVILDDRLVVSLRWHHTSNAGLYDDNTGIDVQSIELEWRL